MKKFLFTPLPSDDLGLLIRPLPLAAELRAKIKNVLTDPTSTQNAQRISEKLKTYGGATEAAQLIEDFSGEGSL